MYDRIREGFGGVAPRARVLGRLALWALVALIFVRGLGAIFESPTPEPDRSASSSGRSVDDATAAFAVRFARSFLADPSKGSLASFFPPSASPPAGASSPGVPPDVQIFEIQGPFFFGAAHKFRHTLDRIATSPRVLILRLRQVPAMDATGLRALEEVLAQCRRSETTLVLSGVHPQPRALLARSGFLDRLGPDRIFPDLTAALRWIRG